METTETIVVRAARRDDMASVVAIYNDAVARTTATFDYEPRSLAQQEGLFDEKQRDGYGFVVAEDATHGVLGFATYGLFRGRPGWRFACEHSVYVGSAARRRGLGRRLIAPLVEHARERGFHTMVGVVDAGNAASMGLHHACGFETFGLLKEAGFKFDRWLDVAFVGLRL
ncbi:MAG: N-acetyltransferase family protein [Deltaproteobacteria bacterium]|nr:N-acetyltransferase family protein [Myxococcales bacterium]MDP3218646.1 N-acetyltransferase family protein [Deltaproteobacteria bacterium]